MIKFDEATHTYSDEGIIIPSVTQILQDSKACDYGMMDKKWREFAMLRGRYVHKATELYDRGTLKMDTLDPQIAPYIQAYIKLRQDCKWKIVLSEHVVYNKKDGYAGTLDRLFDNGHGKYLIADIKSSETAPDWLGLQLAAYAMALVSTWDKPAEIPDCIGICLRKDGTYSLTKTIFPKATKANYVVFKAAIVMAKHFGRKVLK